MTLLFDNHTPRRGRVFPERRLSSEGKARRQAEGEEFAIALTSETGFLCRA